MPSKLPPAATGKRIPASVREAVLARLELELERYILSGEAGSFDLAFRGDYLYVASRADPGAYGGRSRSRPLCRLRYCGDIESWDLEMYKFSDETYDEDGD